ncbi:hypothetical protein GCM10023223_35040 [Stackebrandtia albiflava]
MALTSPIDLAGTPGRAVVALRAGDAEATGADSAIVPHSPQSGQRPTHLGTVCPHAEQEWTVRAFLAIPERYPVLPTVLRTFARW